MNRRRFIRTLSRNAAAAALPSLLTGCGFAAARPKPNIIIFFTDNQGYGDLGCYGAEGFQTPNIDSLAIDGVRFTDFYAMAACTPSRASLLTGCYPPRCGAAHGFGPKERFLKRKRPIRGLHPDEVTIAEVLKPLGYATTCVGKWHLGNHPDFLPTKQGFDSYFGIPYSPDMTKTHLGDPPLPLMRDEEIIEQPVNLDTVTLRYTEEAVKYIESNKDRPFFLYLPHTRPHPPLHVADRFRETTERGLYGDVIEEIDWSVGEILNKLEQLNLSDNTLVIYVSDNGPYLQWGEQAGSQGPFRGGIGSTLEGGMRVPCVMRFPGLIRAASTCRSLATVMDLLPTIAGLAGTQPPQDRDIDGRNIIPLLKNPASPSPYEFFLYYYTSELQAVRSGYWKLHVPHKVRTVAETLPNPDGFNEAQYLPMELSLFDLRNDLKEEVNLVQYYPEVVQRLLRYIDWGRKNLGDSLTGSDGLRVRPHGERM